MNMNRSKFVQLWFTAVASAAAVMIALGMSMTISTGSMLLALATSAPLLVLRLWPGVQPLTASDVIHGRTGGR
jgi:hypothetical protein